MRDPYSIIHTILITEKAMDLKDHDQYAFKVDPRATKIDIARAIEEIYKGDNVKVKAVNIMNRKGKPRRTRGRRVYKQGRSSSFKRAVVTLTEGAIEIM